MKIALNISFKFLVVFLIYFSHAAIANTETLAFKTESERLLYQTLIAEFRCLVCQNQNLADSNADLANDLKEKTYGLVVAGKQRQEIVSYMVSRYGDFVLYRPPLKTKTIILWVGPFVLFIVIIFIAFRKIRPTASATGEEIISAEQEKNIKTLLQESDR